ncbi:VTT domain-containing protein [Micromonospora sp. WMMD710]|uniref:VTT domain-containing protein n=1 Tax=Micromonospora sp. WMMD710 TaxID=3016085 RepID=UPI002417E158|nr:VTT domain-containing protein [Micromonospora sp. WMMD710]MDG4757310.1 VTT domain-containing protein [Micromonospora sp. WMMD710]
MSGVVQAAAALGYGFASALVPVVNAEAYAVVAGRAGGYAVIAVLALAVGQTAGKLLLFEAARRGGGRLARRLARRNQSRSVAARVARWAEPVRRWLSHRRTGLPTVLLSAAVGVPPLALVSTAAGTAGLRHREFAAACLLGRVVRFAILALPSALA